jgi:hypothetical protein
MRALLGWEPRGLTLIIGALAICFGAGCSGKITGGGGGGGGGEDAGVPQGDSGPVASCCDDCLVRAIGIGEAVPFDVQADENEFVDTDSAGALVVNKQNSKYNRFLWVADTNLPGAVKIDLESFTIVGRYRTLGSSTSRTTVNALGEAFVGARSGTAGVTKILPDGAGCPDTNGDGVITTSTGPNDVLAYGQDDCVAWHTQAQGDIRGLAAQDIVGVDPSEVCSNNDTPVDVPNQHYVWAGGLHGKVYKLDAKTGAILMTLDAPSSVYGMALAGDGRLWTGQGLAFIDTLQCVDEATCQAAPVCSQSCSEMSCPDTCDGAVKATISGISGYGITVDCKDRVWMSSGATKRYDPNGAVNMRFAQGPSSGSGGIAADASGWIWASNGTSTTRIDAETMAGIQISAPNKGVAIDSDGRVITVQNTGVHLIEPGATLNDYTLSNNVAALEGFAYAYSDMTGVQTRLASDEPGWYRHVFEGCDEGASTDWRKLEWDVETPTGTYTLFSVRSADNVADLADAPWKPAVSCASGEDCMTVEETGRFIEVEVRLTASAAAEVGAQGCSFEAGASARIKRVAAKYSFTGPIE